MSKQDLIERRDAGEDIVGTARVVKVFEEHYQLAVKFMPPPQAAANAHDAVQRYLASIESVTPEGGGP